MNKFLLLWTIMMLQVSGLMGQDCKQKYEEANSAFFNGNFDRVEELIKNCLVADLDRSSRFALLQLAIRNSLMLSNTASADDYMKQLLELDPYFQPGDFDPVLFRKIHESYEIEPVLSYGGTLGLNFPNVIVLRARSYASETNEPSDYRTFSTPLIGLTAWKKLIGKIYLSAGLLYQSTEFYQQEIILSYQQVTSAEQLTYLNLPIQFRSQIAGRKVNPYLSAGLSFHYLLAARADLNHFAVETDFALPYPGLPESTVNYNLDNQRTVLAMNYIASLGVSTRLASSLELELGINYEYGLKNLTAAEERFSDNELLEKYAYVSDDFTVNQVAFVLSIRKVIDKPIKKK